MSRFVRNRAPPCPSSMFSRWSVTAPARRPWEREAASLDATARLVALLDSGDDRVRFRAALAILDRTGHGPAQRIELQARARGWVDREDATEEPARLLSGMDAAAK